MLRAEIRNIINLYQKEILFFNVCVMILSKMLFFIKLLNCKEIIWFKYTDKHLYNNFFLVIFEEMRRWKGEKGKKGERVKGWKE